MTSQLKVLNIPSQASIKSAQKLMRLLVPRGDGLADELIADRRAEAAREAGHARPSVRRVAAPET